MYQRPTRLCMAPYCREYCNRLTIHHVINQLVYPLHLPNQAKDCAHVSPPVAILMSIVKSTSFPGKNVRDDAMACSSANLRYIPCRVVRSITTQLNTPASTRKTFLAAGLSLIEFLNDVVEKHQLIIA